MNTDQLTLSSGIEALLASAGVKPSPVRVLVCKVLQSSQRPLSTLDIEERLVTVDRSSITRTMQLFTDRGVVHAIDDGSGSTKYELCHDHTNDDDRHPHFHCLGCGATYCLSDLPVPPAGPLPEGFSARSVNYVIKGYCPQCSDSK